MVLIPTTDGRAQPTITRMFDRHVWRNWGRNQQCRPATIEAPRSELEVAESVNRARTAGQSVKVAGHGHSFTDIACTEGRMLSIDALDRVLHVDDETGVVTVEAGISIRRLNHELAARGLALANLGDIDRQTIAGAVSTATHGTGHGLGGLATFIRGIDMITADGSLLQCSADEEPEIFHCARVGLGALGVVTKLQLQTVPAFNLHHLEEARPYDEVLAGLDSLIEENDHFELYWLPHTDKAAIIANNRTDAQADEKGAYKTWRAEVFFPNVFFGGVVVAGKVAPKLVPRLAEVVADSLGKTRLVKRSDRIFVSTRFVRFVEMEYAIPRANAVEAMLGVRDLIDEEGLRVSFPMEVRFVASDDIPLSTAYGRETCYIAVHMATGVPFERYFRGVEAIMDRFDGRPHWGKMHFQTAATLAPRYPEWERFRSVRAKLDPDRSFANPYLDRVLGPE
jgi:L-gulonolactone oxidase